MEVAIGIGGCFAFFYGASPLPRSESTSENLKALCIGEGASKSMSDAAMDLDPFGMGNGCAEDREGKAESGACLGVGTF